MFPPYLNKNMCLFQYPNIQDHLWSYHLHYN